MKLLFEYSIINEAFAKADLISAIKNKNVVKISYEGDVGNRLVEPRLIGRTIAGNLATRAFQISGPTNTSNMQWKIFLLSKIDSLEVTEENISDTRPQYNPHGDEMFAEIIIQN